MSDHAQQLVLTQDVTIETVATLAEYRDKETGNHIIRTQSYVRELAKHLALLPTHQEQLTPDYIELLHKSAPLHDIGKIGVPDHILLKPGKLSTAEFEEMKRHTVYGRDALLRSGEKLGKNCFLNLAAEIAYSHQERWDGSGYLLGLRREDIPLSGRIMAVADVYDALISPRVYKSAMSHDSAIDYIRRNSGTLFDPDIVNALLEHAKDFLLIAQKYADSAQKS